MSACQLRAAWSVPCVGGSVVRVWLHCQPVYCVSCVSSETKDKPIYIEETLTRLTKTAYGKHKAKHKQ